MNSALHAHDHEAGAQVRSAPARWASFFGWFLAAILACVSSVALAAAGGPRDPAREWVEFEAASSVGLPGDAWLRAPEGGYADLFDPSRPVRARPEESDADAARPRVWQRSPSASRYVDLGGSTSATLTK